MKIVFCISNECRISYFLWTELLKLDIELEKRYYSLFFKRIHMRAEKKEQQNGYLLFNVRCSFTWGLRIVWWIQKIVVLWFDWISWIFVQGMNDVGFVRLSFHVLHCTYIYFIIFQDAWERVCLENIYIFLHSIPWRACRLSHSYHSPFIPFVGM